MVFNSKHDFMVATRDYTIQWDRTITFIKNDKVRCRAICKNEDCPWLVYCAINKHDRSWQIKTLVDNHTCGRKRKNRWTVNKLHLKLRKHPIIKHREPKPERPTTKRRKDKNEGPSGTRSKMKRKYNPIRCMFCSEVGHNKRTCKKKKQMEAEEQAR
ncbi:hypothetical protein Ahy_B01g057018 [Arachis hypogaea]|uniref:Transposase MuDR plant domain-containing protein n=1 Tax=Arachis hypogaea TaxID=3818 RepID=A0A445B031_ARAHY|nr:hypothetical protein Ahy_B01g057018 [Arachis hypogaea]